MTAGERIKELRNLHGYRQSDLADKAGCSAQVISNIERGETGVSAALAGRIAAVLGVQIEEFLTDIPDGRVILSNDEAALVRNYRKLLASDRELLQGIMQLMAGRSGKA